MKIILSFSLGLIFITSQVWAESRFVQRVDEGNELVWLNGDRVHLIGLGSGGVEVSKESTEFIRGMISGKVVELEYDTEKVDAEGNILAYVWFAFEQRKYIDSLDFPENYIVQYKGYDSGEGSFYVFVNATVIKSGYAQPEKKSSNLKYAKLFDNLFEQRKLAEIDANNDFGLDTKIVTTSK